MFIFKMILWPFKVILWFIVAPFSIAALILKYIINSCDESSSSMSSDPDRIRVRFEAFTPGIDKWQPVGGTDWLPASAIHRRMKVFLTGRVERVRAVDCRTGCIIDMC